jgi:hypothetical protein
MSEGHNEGDADIICVICEGYWVFKLGEEMAWGDCGDREVLRDREFFIYFRDRGMICFSGQVESGGGG